MTYLVAIIVTLASLAAPVVILLRMRKSGAEQLVGVAQRLGLQLKVGRYYRRPYAMGQVEGSWVALENFRTNRAWVAHVATRSQVFVFKLRRRDWSRDWTDRLPFGSEVPLRDRELAQAYMLRSKSPDLADWLFSRPEVCARLRECGRNLYALSAIPEETEYELAGPTLRGTHWYGPFGVPQPPVIVDFVTRLARLSRAIEAALPAAPAAAVRR